MQRQLYQILASIIDARSTCAKRSNDEWFRKHTEMLTALVSDHMPRGSGIDIGTSLDLDRSTGDKLVFATSFHHMDEYGGYDGWTNHTIVIRPSLAHGYSLRIDGRDRAGIKEHLADTFSQALSQWFEPDCAAGTYVPTYSKPAA